MKDKELEEKLLSFTLRNMFPGRKSSSLEEALERALGLKEEKEDESITEDEWL